MRFLRSQSKWQTQTRMSERSVRNDHGDLAFDVYAKKGMEKLLQSTAK